MDEKGLIRRAQFGDKKALDDIIEIYYDEVYSFLYRRTGDKSAAEDIAQSTFIKFIERLPYYKEKSKLKGFIFTIAINTANDYHRAKKREPFLRYENENYGETAQDSLENKEKAFLVRKAIISLPDVQRDVLIMRFYHDMKIKEIASIQKVPISTVKTRLKRAINTLKECEL